MERDRVDVGPSLWGQFWSSTKRVGGFRLAQRYEGPLSPAPSARSLPVLSCSLLWAVGEGWEEAFSHGALLKLLEPPLPTSAHAVTV